MSLSSRRDVQNFVPQTIETHKDVRLNCSGASTTVSKI